MKSKETPLEVKIAVIAELENLNRKLKLLIEPVMDIKDRWVNEGIDRCREEIKERIKKYKKDRHDKDNN